MKNHFVTLTFIMILLTSCAPIATPVLGIPITAKPPTPSALPATAQTEKWKKYQTELARVLLSGFSPKYGFSLDYYKAGVCEWDVLGHAGQLEYVWAFCGVQNGGERDAPAVIYLNESGYAQRAEAPRPDVYWQDDAPKLFPAEMQKKFTLYTGSSQFSSKLHEMVAHTHYRYTHPDQPPLAVLTATPTP
jgi:hypothetical protein